MIAHHRGEPEPPGRRSGEDLTRTALRFPLMHPAVASVMISVTTEAHAREAIDAVRDAPVDVEAFRRLAAAV